MYKMLPQSKEITKVMGNMYPKCKQWFMAQYPEFKTVKNEEEMDKLFARRIADVHTYINTKERCK